MIALFMFYVFFAKEAPDSSSRVSDVKLMTTCVASNVLDAVPITLRGSDKCKSVIVSDGQDSFCMLKEEEEPRSKIKDNNKVEFIDIFEYLKIFSIFYIFTNFINLLVHINQ